MRRQRSRIEEQIESRFNINECASCATQALHWRDAGDVGRMEMNVHVCQRMNVCLVWMSECVSKTTGNKTLINTCVCQVPSLQFSARWQPWQPRRCSANNHNVHLSTTN